MAGAIKGVAPKRGRRHGAGCGKGGSFREPFHHQREACSPDLAAGFVTDLDHVIAAVAVGESFPRKVGQGPDSLVPGLLQIIENDAVLVTGEGLAVVGVEKETLTSTGGGERVFLAVRGA